MILKFDYKSDFNDYSLWDFMHSNEMFLNFSNPSETKYHLFDNILDCNYSLLKQFKQLTFYVAIELEGKIRVRFAYYFLDEKKHKILSGLFSINTFVSLQVPQETKFIKFGIKYEGDGRVNLHKIRISQLYITNDSLRLLRIDDMSNQLCANYKYNLCEANNQQNISMHEIFEQQILIKDLHLLYEKLPLFISGTYKKSIVSILDSEEKIITISFYDKSKFELSRFELSLNTNYLLQIPAKTYSCALSLIENIADNYNFINIDNIYFSLFDIDSSNIFLDKTGNEILRLNIKNLSSKTNGVVIFLSSLFDNQTVGKINFPVYHRITWSEDLKDFCCIYVADPFSYLECTRLSKGSFYFDEQGNSVLFEIGDKIKRILGNNCGKIVVTGSSQGGYAAILLGSIINADYILSDCPIYVADEHPDGFEYLKNKKNGKSLRSLLSVLNKFNPYSYIYIHYFNCDSNLKSFLNNYQKLARNLFTYCRVSVQIGDVWESNSLGHKTLNKSVVIEKIESFFAHLKKNINCFYKINWQYDVFQGKLFISSDFITLHNNSIVSTFLEHGLTINFYDNSDNLLGTYSCSNYKGFKSCLLLEGEKIKISYVPDNSLVDKFNNTSSLCFEKDVSFFVKKENLKSKKFKLEDVSLFLLPNLKSESFSLVGIEQYVENILNNQNIVLPNNKIINIKHIFYYETDSDQRSSFLWIYSLFWLTPLSYVFLKNNDQEIKNLLKDQIKLFIDSFKNHPELIFNVPSSDHCCAIRFISLCNAYICLFDDPIGNDIIDLLNNCIKYITDVKNISFYNHGLMMVSSLYNLSNLLNQNSCALLDNIVLFCDKYLYLIYYSNTCSDGVFKENTIGYHNFNVRTFKSIIELFDRNREFLPHSQELKNALKQSNLATQFLVYNDGSIPPVGDSPLMLSHIKSINRNHFFKEQNLLILKDEKKYILFKCGYLSGIHKHVDDASFVLRYYSNDIVTDCGSYNYDLTDPVRQYCESFRGHSCCYPTTLENTMRLLYLSRVHKYSKILDFVENNICNRSNCVLKLNNGFTLHRTLIDKQNLLIIEDEVENEESNDISIRFNLSPKAKIVCRNSNFVIVKIADTIACFYCSHKVQIVKGFVSYTNFKYQENSVILMNDKNVKKNKYVMQIFYNNNVTDLRKMLKLSLGNAYLQIDSQFDNFVVGYEN